MLQQLPYDLWTWQLMAMVVEITRNVGCKSVAPEQETRFGNATTATGASQSTVK